MAIKTHPAALFTLRKITRVTALVILLLVGVGFFLPSDYKVERSIVIHAPRDLIYSEMFDADYLPNWLYVRNGKVASFQGRLKEGDSVALLYSESSDAGELTLVQSSSTDVRFDVKPKANMNVVHNHISLQEVKEGTLVAWTIQGELSAGLLSPYLAIFANDMAGSHFERSLQALKDKIEMQR